MGELCALRDGERLRRLKKSEDDRYKAEVTATLYWLVGWEVGIDRWEVIDRSVGGGDRSIDQRRQPE